MQHQQQQQDDDGGSIARLPLPPYLRSRLLGCGYSSVRDLSAASALDLSREASISPQDALLVLKLVPGSSVAPLAGATTAWDLLCRDKCRRKIVTSSAPLDNILGGGICPRDLTEICGVPGVGKTQLGMQLAINVQIPRALGGLGGHSIFIDTEGSFMLERALEMAKAFSGTFVDVSMEELLSHIFYFRVFDSAEQIATINSLPSFLETHPQVKLVVIDSITFHFRQDFQDLALRTRLLNSMAQKLLALASQHDLAVVLVNQVTVKGNGQVGPALGESWSHTCTNRIILRWMDGNRQACVYKSPSLPTATASFSVAVQGIRD